MNAQQEQEIVRRLEARYQPPSRASASAFDGAVQKIVEAGASRVGVRRGAPDAFDACALAPPLARVIDHTALKPETTEAQIVTLCDEARRYCFASVCVNPVYVPLAARELGGSPVRVCTVVGFPLGATTSQVKAYETEQAVRDGATEIDMVLAVGLLKSGQHDKVERDIRAVVEAAKGRVAAPALVKVILETALLTDEEKVIACVLAQNAGADFVKTSTGFSTGGATPSDVALMRRVVGEKMGVKASGGVRSAEDVQQMIAHGATRIGASASVAIVKGLTSDSTY